MPVYKFGFVGMKEMEIEIGKLIKKAKLIRCGDGEYPVLSMTMHDGLMFQNDRFKKQIASIDQSQYQVVHRHQLVESFPIDEGVLAVQELTDIGIVSPAYKIWDVDMEKVVPKYLEFALRAPRSIEYYKSKLRGTTARRRSIPDTEFCAMRIKCPALNEQKIIVDTIEKTKQVIKLRSLELDTLDDLIKARFVEMFGDPVINSMGWTEALIGDNCFVTKLAGFEYTQYINYEDSGDVVMVKAQNVKNGKLNRKDLSFISREVSDSLPRSQLAPGDIVMTYVGANIGDVAVIDSECKYHLAPNVAKIRPNAEVYDSTYFMYMLMLLNSYIVKNSADTAKAALGMDRIRKLNVFVPPIELQEEFEQFAKQVDKSKFVYY